MQTYEANYVLKLIEENKLLQKEIERIQELSSLMIEELQFIKKLIKENK